MDDSDVERIVSSIEKKFGKTRTEFASRNRTYRDILLDDYIYGGASKREERKSDGKRFHVSDKQDDKLSIGFKAYERYGRIDQYTIKAIKALIKRGKVK